MNWYQAENSKKKVRQIVIDISPGHEKDSKFGMMFFAAKYLHLMTTTWGTGFFRMDEDPGPYILVRGDGSAGQLRGCPLRVAFSFYRMRAGGLAAIFVEADSPTVKKNINAPHVLFEMFYGLDHGDTKKLISDAFSRDILHLCFAEGDGAGEMSGGMFSGSSINAEHDVIVPFPSDCRIALAEEWKAILKYHTSVPANRRSFEDSSIQMQEENPVTESMVIPISMTEKVEKISWLDRFLGFCFKRKPKVSLLKAAKNGDEKEVHRILVNALDPGAKDEALQIAMEKGFKSIVFDLIGHGAIQANVIEHSSAPLLKEDKVNPKRDKRRASSLSNSEIAKNLSKLQELETNLKSIPKAPNGCKEYYSQMILEVRAGSIISLFKAKHGLLEEEGLTPLTIDTNFLKASNDLHDIEKEDYKNIRYMSKEDYIGWRDKLTILWAILAIASEQVRSLKVKTPSFIPAAEIYEEFYKVDYDNKVWYLLPKNSRKKGPYTITELQKITQKYKKNESTRIRQGDSGPWVAWVNAGETYPALVEVNIIRS